MARGDVSIEPSSIMWVKVRITVAQLSQKLQEIDDIFIISY